MRIPAALRRGDKVAIVSPASRIDGALIECAARVLRDEGFVVEVMPHAKGVCGSFSGSVAERLDDMRRVLEDESVRCVLCSRGGYGAVHLLEELDRMPEVMFDKWLVGFSDITALHALWRRKGVASLHGAMAKYIGRGRDFACYGAELDVLKGGCCDLSLGGSVWNRAGRCEGPVTGGNMAVLGGLAGTRFDPVAEGDILFIEDIAEPIYKVERMMWQLRLGGVFDRLGGLMVGQFTDYRSSADFSVMEEMIAGMVADYDFPVAMGLPVGHIEANHPLVLNRRAVLEVGQEGVKLTYS